MGGGTVHGAYRADRGLDCPIDEGGPASGACVLGRDWVGKKLATTAPLQAPRPSDETGLCRCRSKPVNGCLQEPVCHLGRQGLASVTDGGRLQQLAPLFESSAHN